MPVAVPTGEYTLLYSLDLSPVFGVLEYEETVEIAQPPADILEKRLEQISSEDATARRAAIADLRYFPDEGERIVPALVAALKKADDSARPLILSVLSAFPAQAAEYLDTFLGILETGKGYEPVYAAQLLARMAPADEMIRKAMEKAAASASDQLEKRLESRSRPVSDATKPALVLCAADGRVRSTGPGAGHQYRSLAPFRIMRTRIALSSEPTRTDTRTAFAPSAKLPRSSLFPLIFTISLA